VSNALGLAGITAVLRDLLNDGIVNQNVAGVVGQTVTVTALPPDRVAAEDGTEATQLNLFLRQVTPNLGWRNEGLPARDGSGRTRLSNPPLALDLHYLISAYGAADLHAEIVLGYAMQLLHENPVLTREAIRIALQRPPDDAATLPPALRALAGSGLQDQVEGLRITPEYLNSEELSKFWTAAQARYRSSAAYQVSVVLIQATDPTRSPLPVLSHQIFVRPDLLPPVPTIDAVVPDASQPVAQLGTTIGLTGHHLDGTGREVVLVNDRFEIEETLPAIAIAGSSTSMQFSIPIARAADFPAGVYRVGARVLRPGENAPRETNRLGMTIAPKVTGLPTTVTRDAGGTATFTIDFSPALRAGQTVSLVLGRQEFAPEPFAPPVTVLDFAIPNAPVADHLARLRIDGMDSLIIDRTAPAPKFLDQRIKIE
jgi:Pvc16 N-terminal domain